MIGRIATIVAALAIITAPASAEQGPWASGFIGRMTCEKVSKLIQDVPNAQYIVDDWARGFMTGMNWARVKDGAAEIDNLQPLNIPGPQPWDEMKSMCAAHPERDIAEVWVSVYPTLHLSKITLDQPGFMSSLKKLIQ